MAFRPHVLGAALAASATAQTAYPTKPITIVVPASPGGAIERWAKVAKVARIQPE